MSLIITSFLISLIAALWVWMAGRKDPQGRPWLTILCMLMLLVLPLLTLLPKFQWEALGVIANSAQGSGTQSSIQSTLLQWLMTVWLFGSVLMLFRLVRGQRELAKWIEESKQASDHEWQESLEQCANMLGVNELPALRVKKDLSSPVVAGLLKPVILIPATAFQWPEETRKMAMLHELGHIRRKDLWLRLAADITCAIHWYNPLVWWMRATLLTQCEYACDARVIASGANPKRYISALCDVVESAMQHSLYSAGKARPAAVCAMADHAPLKMRVKRLLHGQRVGNPWLAVVAAVLTTATALGLTLVRPVMKQAGGVGMPESEKAQGGYGEEEIDLRHSADPFPGSR